MKAQDPGVGPRWFWAQPVPRHRGPVSVKRVLHLSAVGAETCALASPRGTEGLARLTLTVQGHARARDAFGGHHDRRRRVAATALRWTALGGQTCTGGPLAHKTTDLSGALLLVAMSDPPYA